MPAFLICLVVEESTVIEKVTASELMTCPALNCAVGVWTVPEYSTDGAEVHSKSSCLGLTGTDTIIESSTVSDEVAMDLVTVTL